MENEIIEEVENDSFLDRTIGFILACAKDMVKATAVTLAVVFGMNYIGIELNSIIYIILWFVLLYKVMK